MIFEKKAVMMYKDEEEKHLLDDQMDKPVIVDLLRIIPPKLGGTYYGKMIRRSRITTDRRYRCRV